MDDAFEGLHWSIFKLLPSLADDNNGKGAAPSVVLKIMFFLLLLLLIVGDEAVKLIFRKGFGTKGVHWWKATLCTVCFGGIGLGMLAFGVGAALSSLPNENLGVLYWWSTSVSLVVGGSLLTYLAGLIAYKAFLLERNREQPEYYRGDSSLLAYLMDKGWSQSRVQNVAEPLALLAASVALILVNPICSAPLAFCAVSSWVVRAAEAFMRLSQVRDMLANRGYEITQADSFSTVNF